MSWTPSAGSEVRLERNGIWGWGKERETDRETQR